jgi:hypothetical protein
VESHSVQPHLLGVRRRVRRRKRGLKARIKHSLKNLGRNKKAFIVAAGCAGIVLAFFLYDLLFAVFPLKLK